MADIDPSDRQLLGSVRAALDAHDPVPSTLLQSARESLTWLTVEAELATLSEDSALATTGVRSADSSRMLTFECSTGVIVLEVATTGESRRIVGHSDRFAHLRLRHPAGERELDTDEHGRFQVDDVAAGPVSLRCVFADAPEAPVVTSWVVV